MFAVTSSQRYQAAKGYDPPSPIAAVEVDIRWPTMRTSTTAVLLLPGALAPDTTGVADLGTGAASFHVKHETRLQHYRVSNEELLISDLTAIGRCAESRFGMGYPQFREKETRARDRLINRAVRGFAIGHGGLLSSRPYRWSLWKGGGLENGGSLAWVS